MNWTKIFYLNSKESDNGVRYIWMKKNTVCVHMLHAVYTIVLVVEKEVVCVDMKKRKKC